MPYRILSVDGGGVYGIASAIIIRRIDDALPGFIDKTNLIAGTSIGGIITLGLAFGYSPFKIESLFSECIELVSHRSLWRKIKSCIGWSARYDDGLHKFLCTKFADTKMEDLQKRVFIPTFDLDSISLGYRSWKVKFIHNFPGQDTDGKELVADVAWRTSAAPVFFQTAGKHIDGGIFANNPAIAAICQTQDPRNDDVHPNLSDIIMLSIGRRDQDSYLKGSNLDWGYVRWIKHLYAIMKQANDHVVHYQCEKLLKSNYHRIHPLLEGVPELDDWESLPKLVKIGEEYNISEAIEFLKTNW